jgi:hypothetical protein
MIRDPFYQDIIRGLNGELDPELFEQCAADILRAIYPGLVPIRGGSDTGMDGAISDAEGVAFPLVTTTQEDVIGNLTKNLKSYLKNGGLRRKVVLATSRKLTPKKKRNLEERASELGFTLIHVCSQEAIANLLYRNTPWCKELLGLTGQPPALSVIPITSRPQIVELLIGRENDLIWLENTDGDLLLVGQPGSGKTFLMQTFARKNEGLFLINDDPTQIAVSVREQEPRAIIADDAHMDTNRLNKLQQLREQIGAEFRIIATCWPGQKDNVLHCMQLLSSSVHELEPLTRDQIVELIKSTGIVGPTELIRELVNQAEGRPGLAATLCHLCLKGDIRQIALGDALSRDIRTTFEPLLGREATAIVAAFSFGGDKGMSMETVATQFKLSPVNVQQIATGLAAGGVLTDVGQDRLAVRPPSLRYALIRDVFFCGATSLPYNELINQSPDIAETTLTLIGARARGAVVPDNLLTELVNRADSDKVWENYSYLGPSECNYTLDNHPDKLLTVAEAALNFVPQKAIPLLLSHAIGDTRPLHSHPDHSLRKIEDWVKSAEPGSNQATMRRGILLDSALSWFAESNNANITLKAIQFVLSPAFADSEMSPGSQLKVTFRSGLITQAEMSTIRGFWPRIKEFLQAASIQDWSPMFELIHEWLYPGRVAEHISDELRSPMRDFAVEVAKDIVDMNIDHPGVLSHVSRIFKQSEVQLTIDLDPAFDILFPVEDWGPDYKKIQAKQAAAAKKLANNWSSQDAKNIAERIVRYELEARAASLTWPRWSPFVAEVIASKVKGPSTWARAFIKAGADSDLAMPFLQVTASSADPEYSELLKVCLKEPRLQFAGISVGLTAPILPEGILPMIMSALDDRFSNWIEAECMRLHIPNDRLAALLTHTDCSVAAAAAIGEWEATPRGMVREFLKGPWRTAIISGLERQYEGEEIFRKDPSLAFEWLQLRIKNKRGFSYCSDDLRKVALQVIDLDQRKSLLEQIGDRFWDSEVMHGIVDDEPEIYAILLHNQKLKRFHLLPLAGKPNSVWISKALLALGAGYSASEVSQAVYGSFRFWSGNESTYWAQWVESFEPLVTNDDPRIRTVGQIGKDYSLAQKDRALAEERLEDIYGR